MPPHLSVFLYFCCCCFLRTRASYASETRVFDVYVFVVVSCHVFLLSCFGLLGAFEHIFLALVSVGQLRTAS